jgi:hypothetical protein
VGFFTARTLNDPRLSLCAGQSGKTIAAFAWIVPLPNTRWVVVDQHSQKEVYEVAARLPVRIVTFRDIELSTSSAIFEYAQYDKDGKLLGNAAIRPQVAS